MFACALIAGILGGCSAQPSQVALFWVPVNNDITVTVHGNNPDIEVSNSGPGVIGRVDLINAGSTAQLGGIAPGDKTMVSVADGGAVKLAQSSGCNVTVKTWHAKSYEVTDASGRNITPGAP